jgi:hypothetical protein
MELSAASFTIRAVGNGLALVLEEPGRETLVIPLVSSPMKFGGVRWWGRCPSCFLRVLKLYRPPGERRFACRACHRLTYKSAQEHDNRLGYFNRHPEAAYELVDNPASPASRTILAIKWLLMERLSS